MEDVTAVLAFLFSAIGMIALLAVFVFWGADNSSDALPYFVIPALLFVLSGVLGYRAARHGQYS
jgi:heme A synthase